MIVIDRSIGPSIRTSGKLLRAFDVRGNCTCSVEGEASKAFSSLPTSDNNEQQGIEIVRGLLGLGRSACIARANGQTLEGWRAFARAPSHAHSDLFSLFTLSNTVMKQYCLCSLVAMDNNPTRTCDDPPSTSRIMQGEPLFPPV
jgi:hypothetical protein